MHDVFVLQLAGRKHWTVHAPVHADPLRNQPWRDHAGAVAARAGADAPVIDTVLEPGDALYLPRGWLHAATALGEVSAHLTVGVHVVTRFALVEALTALVAERPGAARVAAAGHRRGRPGSARAAPRRRPRGTGRGAAAGWRPRTWRGGCAAAVWTGGRPEPVRPVARAAFADGLAAGDAVRLRDRAAPPAGRRTASRVVLELPDREIGLPGRPSQPALRALLGRAAASVG